MPVPQPGEVSRLKRSSSSTVRWPAACDMAVNAGQAAAASAVRGTGVPESGQDTLPSPGLTLCLPVPSTCAVPEPSSKLLSHGQQAVHHPGTDNPTPSPES